MDWQTLINIGAGGVLALLGWFARELWDIVKQIKNRYNDVNYYKRFVLGLDKSKMRFYDVEASAQNNISDSGQKDTGPAFDKGSFGGGMKAETNYNGFKF